MAKPTPDIFAPEQREPPSSFTIETEILSSRVVRWRGPVMLRKPDGTEQRVECETGYSAREDSPQRQAALRLEVWLLVKAGEAGREDLLAYARIDRHKAGARPVSAPKVTISEQTPEE